ncbi:MAG: hypothetical protein Kow0089_08220 [Desulfobulbaceae bacterium]
MDNGKDRVERDDPHLTVKGLQGRQSVRTTFRLPEEMIHLLSAVASQLGLKQKTLFDQLVEDEAVLRRLAGGAAGMDSEQEKRRQKTFVISRRSLETLERVSREERIPRDLLVQVSIQRLLPIMNAEQEKHRRRIAILDEFMKCRARSKSLLDRSVRLLGRDDPACRLVERAARAVEENFAAFEALVEKGRSMEAFQGDSAASSPPGGKNRRRS